MCGPAIVPALIAASTVVTAGSQIYAGNVATAQARYETKVANMNAQQALSQAADARAAGQQQLTQQYRQNAQVQGAQRAALAANGIEADFGSGAAVQQDARLIGWEDADTIRRNTAQQVKGYEINASNYRTQAAAAKAKADAQGMATILGVTGTILGGAEKFAKAGK